MEFCKFTAHLSTAYLLLVLCVTVCCCKQVCMKSTTITNVTSGQFIKGFSPFYGTDKFSFNSSINFCSFHQRLKLFSREKLVLIMDNKYSIRTVRLTYKDCSGKFSSDAFGQVQRAIIYITNITTSWTAGNVCHCNNKHIGLAIECDCRSISGLYLRIHVKYGMCMQICTINIQGYRLICTNATARNRSLLKESEEKSQPFRVPTAPGTSVTTSGVQFLSQQIIRPSELSSTLGQKDMMLEMQAAPKQTNQTLALSTKLVQNNYGVTLQSINPHISTSGVKTKICFCLCSNLSKVDPHITKEDLKRRLQVLSDELTVNKKMTSNYRNRFISVADNRQSSRAIGTVGILVLCLPMFLMVTSDLTHCIRAFRRLRHQCLVTRKNALL